MSTQGERLKEFRKYLHFNQTQFADYLGFTQAFVTKIEKSDNAIPHTVLSALIKKNNTNGNSLRINFDWLLTGKGKMIVDNEIDNTTLMGDAMGKPNIVVVPFAANAGVGIESQLVEVVTKAYLPFVKDLAYAFHVKGNSMAPVFENKDWVVCYAIEDESTMRPGSPYILKLTNCEYVLKYVDKRGSKWVLRSENYRDYANREIDREEVECIYEIKLRLTEYWGWGE